VTDLLAAALLGYTVGTAYRVTRARTARNLEAHQ